MAIYLSAQRIAAYRTAAAHQVTVEVLDETGSTNADLMARLGQLSAPVLLAAERQTAGRGRAGRTWHSVPGAVLTFSIAWSFNRPLHTMTGLPLAVGVALVEALSAFGVRPQLKWPNDILKEGKKLAGVLIETAKGSAAESTWAVIGVGLNVALPEGFEERIGRPVASLDRAELDRNHVVGAMMNSMAAALTQFEQQGLSAFTERWNRWHAYAGQAVCILDGECVLHEGRAIGIDTNGALLLETVAGLVDVLAGDVSLRTAGEGKHAVTG